MLGQICAKTDRTQLAVDYLKGSLQLNPFLWNSYELLVELGADVEPSDVFSMSRPRSSSNTRPPQATGLCPSPSIAHQTTPHNVSLKRENSQGGSAGLRRSNRLNNSSRTTYSKENTKSTSGTERIERSSKTPNKKPKRAGSTTTV